MKIAKCLNEKILFSLLLIPVLWSTPSYSEFVLNFQPDNTGVMTTTGGSSTPWLMVDPTSHRQQPETVVDPETGITYIHTIMGSLAEGFIQEVYVQAAGGNYCWSGWQNSPYCVLKGSYMGDQGLSNRVGNAANPLSSDTNFTGNGTANPRRVIMRQIVTDGEMTMEFLKDKFDRKPVIVQSLVAPDINSMTMVDMRNSTYDDITSPAIVTNTMSLLGADAPADSAQFNMATDVQDSNITGGRFTYADGAGNGASGGDYTYLNGDGFGNIVVDWAEFYDANDPTNSWSVRGTPPE